jgi:hypothetical protein
MPIPDYGESRRGTIGSLAATREPASLKCVKTTGRRGAKSLDCRIRECPHLVKFDEFAATAKRFDGCRNHTCDIE